MTGLLEGVEEESPWREEAPWREDPAVLAAKRQARVLREIERCYEQRLLQIMQRLRPPQRPGYWPAVPPDDGEPTRFWKGSRTKVLPWCLRITRKGREFCRYWVGAGLAASTHVEAPLVADRKAVIDFWINQQNVQFVTITPRTIVVREEGAAL